MTPVGALWVDGTFWFQTGDGTVKRRNIMRGPQCSVSIRDADVVMEGAAVRVEDPSTIARLAKAWADQGWPAEPDDEHGDHGAVRRAVARTASVARLPRRADLGVGGAGHQPGGLRTVRVLTHSPDAAAGRVPPMKSAPSHPNVVFILADDLGWADLGCSGSTTIRTPNLDRLTAEGIRFTHGYSATPWCSSTRLALYTGRNPGRLEAGLEEPLRTRRGDGHPGGASHVAVAARRPRAMRPPCSGSGTAAGSRGSARCASGSRPSSAISTVP